MINKITSKIGTFFKHFFSSSSLHVNSMEVYTSIIFVTIIVGYLIFHDISYKMIELFIVTALGSFGNSLPTSIFTSIQQNANNSTDNMSQLMNTVGNLIEEKLTAHSNTQSTNNQTNQNDTKSPV